MREWITFSSTEPVSWDMDPDSHGEIVRGHDKAWPFPVRGHRFPRLSARLRSIRHGTHIAYDNHGFTVYRDGRKRAVHRPETTDDVAL